MPITIAIKETNTQFAVSREALHGFKTEDDANLFRQVNSITDELHHLTQAQAIQLFVASGIPAVYVYDEVFFKERGNTRSDADPEAWKKSDYADWSLATENNDRLRRIEQALTALGGTK